MDSPNEQDCNRCKIDNLVDLYGKHLSLSRIEKIEVIKRRSRLDQPFVPHRRPLSLAHFTIGQLLFILTEIQKNFLTDTHYFYLNGYKVIVQVLEPEQEVAALPSAHERTTKELQDQLETTGLYPNPDGGNR